MTELSDYRRMVEKPMIRHQAEREKNYREALRAARAKLEIMFKQTNGVYGGGDQYANVIGKIDAALKQKG